MADRNSQRRTLSLSEHRWVAPYLVIFLVAPSVFIFLFSLIDLPEEPPNQYAEQVEEIRFERGPGFPAAPGTHKVIRVITGDTLDIRAPGTGVTRVRLDCVAAPRKGQRYWLESRRYLAREIDGLFVTVSAVEHERSEPDGPPPVSLTVGDDDIARRIISDGFAWTAADSRCSEAYESVQRQAENSRRGLWQGFNPTPPWRWEPS